MDMCYDGTLSTAFGLSSWLFTEGEKHGGMYIGFDSKKKKQFGDMVDIRDKNVSNVTKLILIIFYIVIFKNTELPNSFFIRFASKNEALLDRRNQKIKESEKIIVVKIIADVSWLCAWTFG